MEFVNLREKSKREAVGSDFYIFTLCRIVES